MKILLVDGGPRKGNTWNIAMKVRDELNKLSPDIEWKELHLSDINLPLCIGCSMCFRKGHSYCPHNEMVQEILDSIDESDGIIYAAPTYNLSVPAISKNLIDHICYALHRPRYFTKKALVISSTGGVGASKTTKYLAGTLAGIGFNHCFQLPVSTSSWNAYQISPKVKQKIERISKKFYLDLAFKKLHAPSFGVLIPFNLIRGMSITCRPGSEYEAADGTFWQQEGYVDQVYAPGIPLPFYKKLFGKLMYQIAISAFKNKAVTYKK